MSQKIVVNGILERDGLVFIAKRAAHKRIAPGKWHLPGGHVEFGEDPEAAVVREFKEEFDLDIKIIDAFRTFSYVEHGDHTVGITFVITADHIPEHIPLDPHDTQAVKWITAGQVDDHYSPGDQDLIVLRRFFKASNL